MLNWCLIFNKCKKITFWKRKQACPHISKMLIFWRTFHESLRPSSASLECASRITLLREGTGSQHTRTAFWVPSSCVDRLLRPPLFNFPFSCFASFPMHDKEALEDLGGEVGTLFSHERWYRLWSLTALIQTSIPTLIRPLFSHL